MKRVPVDKNQKLGPGEYEIVSTLKGGDPGAIKDKLELQKQLQLKFGPNLTVLDWGTKGTDLIIRFKIAADMKAAAAMEAHPVDEPQMQAMFIPVVYAVISAVALIGALYLLWRISCEIKEVVQLVTTTPVGGAIGTGVAVATGGVGIALIAGVGLLVWATLKRDGQGVSKAFGNLRGMFRVKGRQAPGDAGTGGKR